MTTGKAYLDVRQALAELGIDEARAREPWVSPSTRWRWSGRSSPRARSRFARGLDDLILVIEEKRPVLEEQLARALYNEPSDRPRLSGKQRPDRPRRWYRSTASWRHPRWST